MSAPTELPNSRTLKPVLVFAVLALVLSLRVMHLSSSLQSPLSYQPGPDEDYYLRFAEAVAAGQGQDSAEFTFMDPAYGYVLGAVFKLFGANVFVVYVLQVLLDTATAYGILRLGVLLGRRRAGLYGALLYGLTATAIMFCAALLKEVCVASYLTWWMVSAVAVCRSDRKWAWTAFGVLCGVGVALRSTLLLLGVCAMLLPLVGVKPGWLAKSGLVALGLALSLAPWSIRNHRAVGGLSPLPHNGGIVLHQAYNAQNPRSAIWIPAFVNYSHPSAIWRGYAAEAERRSGHAMTPSDVDGYWQGEALRYIRTHPAQVARDIGLKGLAFLASTEVPNNRSSVEERMFSAVMAFLPAAPLWLLAMGLVGLVWIALQDRRWLILAAPIAISWATFAVFWAEERFRFHAMPALALCSGIWIDALMHPGRDSRRWQVISGAALAVLIAAASLLLGAQFPPPPVRWDHIVWGYIKMGKMTEARALAGRVAIAQPDNGPVIEALGFIAAGDRQYQAAVQDFERAVTLRPNSYVAHFNLAKAYLALGDKPRAAQEAALSMSLDPSPDARALSAQIAAP